jgi:predicted permease
LLSLLGGAAGLVVATWANGLLAASLGSVLSNLGFAVDVVLRTEPDMRVLLATAGFCMFGTLAFGLGPAWQQSRPDVMAAIKEHSGDGGGEHRAGPFGRRNLLVVSQIALSLVMLISAGLFVRASLKAASVDPGFRLDNGILVEIDPGLAGYDDAQSKEVYRRLHERLQSIPGVQAMSVAATVPFGAVSSGERVRRAEDMPVVNGDGSEEVETFRPRSNTVGADYFEALSLPILRGRSFTADETASDAGPRVAIIDELLAESLWPGQDPIGRFVGLGRLPDPEGGDEIEVVGLVPSISEDIFPAARRPHIYQPFGQNFQSAMNIHVRADSITDADARAAMLQAVRREIRAVDAQLPVIGMRVMEDHIAESASLWLVRLGATVFGVFGGLALFLAVIGVYGVKAYAVAQRTREIGIRKALGATTSDTLRLILRESMMVSAAGLGVGLVLGLGVASLLSSILYEVSPYDPVAFLGSVMVLALAAFVATYLPARRAASVTPVTALRKE